MVLCTRRRITYYYCKLNITVCIYRIYYIVTISRFPNAAATPRGVRACCYYALPLSRAACSKFANRRPHFAIIRFGKQTLSTSLIHVYTCDTTRTTVSSCTRRFRLPVESVRCFLHLRVAFFRQSSFGLRKKSLSVKFSRRKPPHRTGGPWIVSADIREFFFLSVANSSSHRRGVFLTNPRGAVIFCASLAPRPGLAGAATAALVFAAVPRRMIHIQSVKTRNDTYTR